MDAAGLFREGAYQDVSVAQLVAKARVQPPTLYHYFGDKEGLFVEWAETSIDVLGNEMRNGLQPPADFRTALAHIGGCLASPRHPGVLQIQRDTETLVRPESRERIVSSLHQAVFEPLYAILLVGMERGMLKPDPVRRTASVFIVVADAHRPGNGLSEIEAMDDFQWWVDRFLRGFGAGGI